MAGFNALCIRGTSKPLDLRPKTTPARVKTFRNRPMEKVYTASGQAPSPSKDFFELIVAKDRVVWRSWRIKYKNHRMILPAEECITYEEFQNDGNIHRDIVKNLGDDVLQISMGYISKEWLARLPLAVLQNILSNLGIEDLISLSQVCSTLRIRCLDSRIWKRAFFRTFGAWDDIRERRAAKIGWRRVFIEDWQRRKSKLIDWDDL